MKKNILLSILCAAILLGSSADLEAMKRKRIDNDNNNIENIDDSKPNKKQKSNSIKKKKYNENCSICLESLDVDSHQKAIPSNILIKNNIDVMTTTCNHHFHTKCIFSWVYDYEEGKFRTYTENGITYFGKTCPLCRKKIPEIIDQIIIFDLLNAVKNNNLKEIQTMLNEARNEMSEDQFKEFINLQNKYEETALILAAYNSNLDIIQALLNAGANCNLKDENEQTALILATTYDNLDIVKALLKAGADCNIEGIDGYTTLMLAAANNNPGIVQALLKFGANCNLKDIEGDTALINAVRNDNLDMVQALLNAGANYNLQNNKRESAIDIARKHNYSDIVKEISNRIINRKTFFNLIGEVKKNNLNEIQNILNKTKNEMSQDRFKKFINIQDKNKVTVLIMAVSKDNLEIVKTLLNAGADYNHQNKNGNTALMFAAYNNNLDMVKTLIKKGADRTLKNNQNESAIDIARKHNYSDIVEELSR